ncbi:hypothetical protein F3Y22_tig00111493pilonHSYRG00154 [Hibiscus syriacus]|uniref:Uncharacterized protein n=1 Tax=Hibiscus syriacus TaxID=106335 RepID=A0A6A2XQ50_HIBSY|nr:hypothetical protein F3Y22_tig00111493pilonHSYRG00154 [Hibiscus syriacus]
MQPSLVAGLQSNLYEWITDVLCRKNGTFMFRVPTMRPGNSRERRRVSSSTRLCFWKLTTESSMLELVHARLFPVLETFGVDPGCLSPGLPDIPFTKAFEDATEVTLLRFVSLHPIYCPYSLQTEAQKQRSDLLTMFMRSKDEQGKPFSNKFLRDICVNFILAGRDTSSMALSWFFWLLGKNPRVEQRILQEICRINNEREKMKNGNESQSSLIFKPEEIKKMDYLQAALLEALRLYPSVPVDHKEIIYIFSSIFVQLSSLIMFYFIKLN